MKLKLVEHEQVIARVRAHHRGLIPALVNLLVTLGVMSFALAYISRGSQPEFIHHYHHIGVFIIWSLGALALAFGTAKPLLSWLNRFTWLTTHRIVQKNIIGSARAMIVPLGLLSDVHLKQSRMQGAAGAGDIILVHGAYGQQQKSTVSNMPDAERFYTLIAEELRTYRGGVVREEAARREPVRRDGEGGWPLYA